MKKMYSLLEPPSNGNQAFTISLTCETLSRFRALQLINSSSGDGEQHAQSP